MSHRANRGRVLVVEDEESIREGVCDLLAYHGFAPTGVEDGQKGLREALEGHYDLVVLDVMLPGINGLDICEQLREARSTVPILMLTAKSSEDDIVNGLRAGADDYVTKPFSVRELVARIEARLRRLTDDGPEDDVFEVDRWRIDPNSLLAQSGDGDSVSLTAREVTLLSVFAKEKSRVVSRRTLLQDVWRLGNVDELETRTVDVHIAKLRKKLRDETLIETVRGVGYRLRPR